MPVTLESLTLMVETSSLDTAFKKVEELGKQVQNLATQLDALGTSSKDAAKNEVELVKIKERLIKAQAKLEETQKKLSESSNELAKAQDNQRKTLPQEDELGKVQRMLEKEATVLKILTGQTIELSDGNVTLNKTFSAGQASKLATLKLAGALSSEFNTLASSITQINSISQVNPFDKTAGSLEKMRKETMELVKVNEYASRGFNLTRDQIIGLTRDIQSVTIASKQAGESTEQLQQRISKLELETVAEANALNMLKQAAKDSELAAKAHAKAEIERANAIAKAAAEADKDAANRRSMKSSGLEEQYKSEMKLLREQYLEEERVQSERKKNIKESFSKELQIKQWKREQDKNNYDADMKAYRDFYSALEQEANIAEKHLAAITARINKEVAMTKFLNAGTSRSTANVAAGMEVKGVPQDVINSFVKEANAKELAAKAAREAAAANEFLRETEQRLAASLDVSNTALNRASTDELVKIKSALDKSGMSADAAAIKFKSLEEKLREVSSKDKARDLQHLARAVSVQLGDVGVSLAGGMNPLLVMIQQGDQIRGVIQQVGADAQQMNGVMKTALGQIVSSFAMVGQAVGSFFIGSIQSAGKAVTDLAMQLTMTGPLFDKLRVYVANNTGETSKATKAIDLLGQSIRVTTGLITAGLVTAYSTAAVAAYKLMQAQTDLNNAVIQNSAVWGLTKSEIVATSEAMVASGTTSLRMLGIFTELAKTGKVTKDALSEVAAVARDLAINGGRSIADITALMTKVYDDPIKGLSAYRVATGLVTQSEMERVEQLVRIGDETAAITEAQKIMASSLKQESINMISDMSPIETLWKDIKSVIADVWQGIQEFAQSDTFLSPLKTVLQTIGIAAYEVYYTITGLGSSIGGLAAKAGAIISGEWDQVLKIDSEIDKHNIDREQKREAFINRMMSLGNKEVKNDQENAKIRAKIAADNASQEKARRKVLDELDKYEDKSKTKMKRAGSRSAYVKSELEDVLKSYQGMTEKEQELFKKMRGEQYDSANKQKKGKTDSEKEANRLMKAYAKDIEAINGITAEAIGYQNNYSKAQQKVLDILSNPNFANYSEEKRKTIALMAEEAIRQSDIAEGQKIINKLIGQADRLGATYYEELRRITAVYESGGVSGENFELAKKRLFEATEQGRAYVNTLREMANKTRELADARDALNVERNAALAGSVTESEEIKRQGEINREKLRIEREYQLKLQEIKDTYTGDAPETVKVREDLIKRNEELRKNSLENLGIKNANQELSSFSQEFKLLIERTNEFGVSLEGAFGGFGKNIGTAISSFAKLGATLEQNQRLLAAAKDDPVQYAKLQKKLAKDEINLYAQTAGAAKQMFGEKTAAAKAFGAIEKTLHIVRLGMLAVEMAETIKSVGITLAADGAKTASALGAMVIDGTAAVVKTIASLPFPMNLAAGAAVAAVVAGLIGSVGGSFNGKVSGSAPKYNTGTGTVFGDKEAKSESINNSIELLEKANSLTQKYSPQMLLHLRNIDASIGGLVNLLIRTGGIEGKAPAVYNSSKMNSIGGVASGVMGISNISANIPIIGDITSKLVNEVVGGIFGKTKTTNLGSGITGDKQTLGSILGSGFDAKYFTDVQIKKSGLFGSSTKYRTYMTEADAELEQQITAVFNSIYNSVLIGAKALGGAESEIVNTLNNFVVDIGKVKLTGTAEEMQQTLTAVFGAAGDTIAKAVVPGLEKFQNVGEGYFETLIRVSTELEYVNSWFSMLGTTLFNLGISGVQASQSLIDMFGGVSNFETSVSDYYDNFYSEQEKINTKTKQLTDAFASLGIQLPTSIEGYRQIVNAQDLTTKSGQETFYSLIQLSSAFKEVIDYSTELASTIEKTVEQYLAELQARVRSNEDIANSIFDYIKNTKQLKAEYSDLVSGAKGVESAVYKLTTEGMHPLEKSAYDDLLAIQELITSYKDQEQAAKQTADTIKQAAKEIRDSLATSYSDAVKLTDDLYQVAIEAIKKQITALEEYAKETDNVMEALKVAVDKEKEAIDSQIESFTNIKDSFTDLVNSLAENIRKLRGEVESTNSALIDQAKLVVQQAMAGAFTDTNKINDAVNTLVENVGAGTYASKTDRDRAFILLSNDLVKLQDVASAQVDYADNQIDALNTQIRKLNDLVSNAQKQVDILRGIKEVTGSVQELLDKLQKSLSLEGTANSQIAELNSQLAYGEKYYNELRGIRDTNVSIGKAIYDLQVALLNEFASQKSLFSEVVKQLMLGTVSTKDASSALVAGGIKVDEGVSTSAGDVAVSSGGAIYTERDKQLRTLNGWSGTIEEAKVILTPAFNSMAPEEFYAALKSLGISAAMMDAMYEWPKGTANEWANSYGLPSFAVGANVLPNDMIAQVHKGEAIIPAKFNPWNGGELVNDNSVLIAEIKALREEVVLLRSEARATATHTAKTAKILDRNTEQDAFKTTTV